MHKSCVFEVCDVICEVSMCDLIYVMAQFSQNAIVLGLHLLSEIRSKWTALSFIYNGVDETAIPRSYYSLLLRDKLIGMLRNIFFDKVS